MCIDKNVYRRCKSPDMPPDPHLQKLSEGHVESFKDGGQPLRDCQLESGRERSDRGIREDN